MPKIQVVDMTGKKVGDIDLADSVFGIEVNEASMHDVVVNMLANARQGTQSALTRSEVSGGGRKPWRQKGTGHARQGSTRAPQWRHGGVVFAPKPRDYSYRLNKKVRRLALKSALSVKCADNQIIVLEELKLDSYSTKTVANMLKAVDSNKKTLIVLPESNKIAVNSTRNIKGAVATHVGSLNVYDILNADKVIILKSAVQKIEEVYAC